SLEKSKPLNSFKVNNNYVQIYDTTLDENIGLNKCLWSHNGQQIILGDDQGKLRLRDINEY
ncbi:unnamed protein product, partial [Rotaria sordida]